MRAFFFFLWGLGVSSETTVVVTSRVEGAQYPVDAKGSECSSEAQQPEEECFGGAAVRGRVVRDFLAEGGGLSVDLGGYFYGSGLFYEMLRGDGAAETFAAGSYAGRSLNFRDFSAPPDELQRHVAKAGVPVVATNLQVLGEMANMSRWVRPFLQEANATVVALLDKIDRQGVTTVPWKQALATALAAAAPTRRADDFGVVLLTGGVPLEDARDLLGSRALDDDDDDDDPEANRTSTIEERAVEAIAVEFAGVDAVILDGATDVGKRFLGEPRRLRNWFGGESVVLAVPSEPRGLAVSRVRLSRTSAASVTSVFLGDDDDVEQASEDSSLVDDLKAEVEKRLADLHVGYVSADVDGAGTVLRGGGCVSAPTISTATKPPTFCGCLVAECRTGNLAADAVRWFAGADVALVKGASLNSKLRASQVSGDDVLEMVPDLGDEIVLIEGVSGAGLVAVLAAAVAPLANVSLDFTEDAFLQVSRGLNLTWAHDNGRAVLREVFLHGKQLPSFEGAVAGDDDDREEDAFFAVAASSRLLEDERFAEALRGGSSSVSFLGRPAFAAVVEYLSSEHASPGVALDPEAEYFEARVVQSPDVREVHVAVLCGKENDLTRREQCDHGLHRLDQINDKHDGVLDDVLPNVRFTAHNRNVGCSVGDPYGGLADIMADIAPATVSLIVSGCSNDIRDVSSVDQRDKLRNDFPDTDGAGNHVVVSPSSTAPSLNDEGDYPYLARLTTPETQNGIANSLLAERYQWGQVCVVHEDTLFATELAEEFTKNFLAAQPFVAGDASNRVLGGGVCISANRSCELQALDPGGDRAVGVAFSLKDLDDGLLDGTEIVRRAAETGAKVIFVSTHHDAQRAIFAASYRENLNSGLGYGWLSGLPSEAAFQDPDTLETINAAVFGAEGALGFLEEVPSYNDSEVTRAYLDTWKGVSSKAGCLEEEEEGQVTKRASYCDGDDDFRTAASYSLFWVDSVDVYARALHATGGVPADGAAKIDPRSVYDVILASNQTGVTGSIVFDESGDRRGILDLLNLVVSDDDDDQQQQQQQLGQQQSRRRLAIDLQSRTASFEEVATFNTKTDVLTEGSAVLFPGRTTTPPSDRDPPTGGNSKKSSSGVDVVLVSVVAALGGALLLIAGVLVGRFYDQKKLDIDKYYKIIRTFDPETGVPNPAPAGDDEEVEQETDEDDDNGTTGTRSSSRGTTLYDGGGGGGDPLRKRYDVDAWLWLDEKDDDDDDDEKDEEKDATKEEKSSSQGILESDPRWRPYGDEEQREIAWAWRRYVAARETTSDRQEAADGVAFEIGGATYRIEFHGGAEATWFEQRNVRSNFARRVQRRPLAKRTPMTWYFDEEERKTNWVASRDSTIPPIEETTWVALADKVQPVVSAAYASWLRGAGPAVLFLNDNWEGTDAYDEYKTYQIDFAARRQKNCQTGYLRDVRVDYADPRVDCSSGAAPCAKVISLLPSGVEAASCLPVEVDDVVELKRTLPGNEAWGRGVIVSGGSGWRRTPAGRQEGFFPLACAKKYFDDVQWTFLAVPRFWTRPLNHIQRVALDPTSAEWRLVGEPFAAHWDVHAAFRLQNPFKWQQYGIARAQALKAAETQQSSEGRQRNVHTLGAGVDDTQERCPVYHGTKAAYVDGIIRGGVKPAFATADPAGAKYGRGAYFAVDPEDALLSRYAPPDDQSLYHVFVCRIVSGRFKRGSSQDKHAGEFYDTTVDDVDDPRVFVTYDVQQAYPLYYLQLKKIYH